MRRYSTILVLVMMPLVVHAWPWSQDMMNQPSIKPQEGPMTPFPHRSVPVTGYPTKVHNREEAKPLKSPVPVTEETLRKGRTLFRIYCSACHGLTGKADSPVSPKIGAIPLVDDYVQKNLTEGWVYGTISFGSYVMPAYGVPTAREDKRGSNDLSPYERWLVVNYVKHRLVADGEPPAMRTAATAQQ